MSKRENLHLSLRRTLAKECMTKDASFSDNYQGKKVINQINQIFFHPNYVTIDHIINKVRCPEKMFDFDNLQLVCWQKC